MVKRIRLCKGREIGQKSYAIGVKNPKWDPAWVRVEFGERVLHVDIEDGLVGGYPVRHVETMEPVSAEEIVKFIYLQNALTLSQNAKGYTRRNHYGELHKWFIDFDSALIPFFEENKIVIPEDRRSVDERMTDAALGDLNAKGYSTVSAGQKALEEAKARAAELKLKETQEELEVLRAEKAKLQEKLERQQETANDVIENVKAHKSKKKEEALV